MVGGRDAEQDRSKMLLEDLELPRCTKYLLISGYLASYNPATTDTKYFSKVQYYDCLFAQFLKMNFKWN